MLDDHQYDVLMQLSEESKSLWRIENEYIPNAEDVDNDELVEYWEELAQDKEDHIEDLSSLLQEVLA